MNFLSSILFCMFLLGIIGIIINRLHILSALLCLELTILSIFLNISTWANITNNTIFINHSIILITFSACEASAGLALLTTISRSHNSNLLANINMLQK